MSHGRYGTILKFPGADDVHWPAGHPLACGVRGNELEQDGDPVSCPRCIDNVRKNLERVTAQLRATPRPLQPKHALPRPSAYRIEPVENRSPEKTNGFRIASGARTRSGKSSKRTWWIFRADGRGHTDLIVRPSGETWKTDDVNTARAFAAHLNHTYRPSRARRARLAKNR